MGSTQGPLQLFSDLPLFYNPGDGKISSASNESDICRKYIFPRLSSDGNTLFPHYKTPSGP